MDYIQYTTPNASELKEQINRVKGDRSMQKFAEDIKRESPNVKVSAATLSRACNWTSGNPVSLELLEAIAKVADKDSGVTLDTLATANGMRSKKDDDDLNKRDIFARRRENIYDLERRVSMILQNEITGRDYPVQKIRNFANWHSLHGYVYQQDRMFPRNYTFGFSVSGMSPCSSWKFALDPIKVPEGSAHSPIEGHVGNFINKVGSVFASDSFESELYESDKYSFVFVDRDLYDGFWNRIITYGILINGLMTEILVDTDNNCVVEERQLPRVDGAEAPSFFKQPIVVETDDMYDYLPDPFDTVEDDE